MFDTLYGTTRILRGVFVDLKTIKKRITFEYVRASSLLKNFRSKLIL